MTPQAVMIELFGRVGASQDVAVLVNDDELSQWPSAAVRAMKSQKMIAKARPASNAICPGCEQDCVMPVHTLPGKPDDSVSFVVCDKRSDTSRVMIPPDRLSQWHCNAELICGFVAESLGLRRSDRPTASADLWEIGIATGDKRSQMLCLQASRDLLLVAGGNSVLLIELIEFNNDRYSLDIAMLSRLVDAASTTDPRYTPSKVKREARKLETQAMYESWQKKYRELKRDKPQRTDGWCSKHISKLSIGQGRDAETIRKNMKK